MRITATAHGHVRHLAGALMAAAAFVLIDPRPAQAVEPGVPDPPSNLLTDRGQGAVTAADKDFVVKVRLAGLWEIPAGEMAQDQSGSARIRAISKDISGQHRTLDQLTRDAAAKLDIPLPAKPNADQQGWLDEMRAAQGKKFDQIYIDRLRAAHGKIFPAIATIRTSTRNDTVRKLAQRANQFVMTHLTLLESSNLVDYASLPTAPPPNAAAAKPADLASAGASQPPSIGLPAVAALMVAAVGGALFVSWRVMRDPRRRRRRYRGRAYR